MLTSRLEECEQAIEEADDRSLLIEKGMLELRKAVLRKKIEMGTEVLTKLQLESMQK